MAISVNKGKTKLWLRGRYLAIVFSLCAFAQKPVFEVASIKPDNPDSRLLRSIITLGGNFAGRERYAPNLDRRRIPDEAVPIERWPALDRPR
jgi:hypothetical protein